MIRQRESTLAFLSSCFSCIASPPGFRNQLKRLIKTPKLHFVDSGLLAALLAVTAEQIAKNRSTFGAVLETFVFSEVMKQVTWSDQGYTLHHYRDKDQDEVDIIVEDEPGALVGIEVKASATVHTSDFQGMRKLLDICGDDLKFGLVLYDGTKAKLLTVGILVISMLDGGPSASGQVMCPVAPPTSKQQPGSNLSSATRPFLG